MLNALSSRLSFMPVLIRYSFPAFQSRLSRFICDRQLLKMDKHEQSREIYARRVKDRDEFWLRILTLQEAGQVFEEDLKTAWTLAEEEHLPVLKNLIEMFLQSQKRMRGVSFGSFKFGSVMMRTCHDLKQPDFAFEIFESPIIQSSMCEVMTIILLLDLLIDTGNYNKAIYVYEEMCKMEWINILRSPIISMLYAVALFKLGTTEALEKANTFNKKMVVSQSYRKRLQNIFGVLALKLEKPQEALDFISQKGSLDRIAWNIKIQAFIKMSRFDDVFKEITPHKHHLFQDTAEYIKAIESDKKILQHSTITNVTLDQAVSSISFEENSYALPLRRKNFFN